jgi:hypothetical protein
MQQFRSPKLVRRGAHSKDEETEWDGMGLVMGYGQVRKEHELRSSRTHTQDHYIFPNLFLLLIPFLAILFLPCLFLQAGLLLDSLVPLGGALFFSFHWHGTKRREGGKRRICVMGCG